MVVQKFSERIRVSQVLLKESDTGNTTAGSPRCQEVINVFENDGTLGGILTERGLSCREASRG